MLMLNKITLASSVALFTPQIAFALDPPADADADAEDDLDDLDNDDAPAGMEGGMPDMAEMLKGLEGMEGLDPEMLEKLKNMGGEGGFDPSMLEGLMGKGAPKIALTEYESAGEAKEAIEARLPAQAVYVFECASESKCHEAARAIGGDAALKANVGFVKAEEGSADKLTVYRGQEETVVFEGDFEDAEAVATWAKDNRIPSFGQIDDTNFEVYVGAAKRGIFWVCFNPEQQDEQANKFGPAFVAAHKARAADDSIAEKFPFVYLDTAKFPEHAKEELGCKTFPTLVLQHGDLMGETQEAIDSVEKYTRSFESEPDSLTEGEILKFFTDITSGELKPEAKPDPLDAMDDDDDDEEVASKDDVAAEEEGEKKEEEKEEL